ncbi:SDR family oxidoreductase [Acidobacteriota bacterium]
MTKGHEKTILLTGATGYVGGRLLRVLEEKGTRVRCLARRPEFLKSRVSDTTQVAAGDVMDPSSLDPILEGVHTAYYMIHSMGSTHDFEDLDRQAAKHFAEVSRKSGVKKIIYLGGLGDSRGRLSPHLQSRQEVGEILRTSDAQVIEFRASIVIGSGSLSFEMIRALVERLPLMITPRWVNVQAQPIFITDLIEYLVAAMDQDFEGNRIYEIGGKDRVSYGDLMREYARQRGLRRLMIPVPVLTPNLSSLWLGLVTPIYARIGRKLVDSMRYETIVRDFQALRDFSLKPKGVREAIRQALRNEDREVAETRWSDAVSSSGVEPKWGGVRTGNRLIDMRMESVDLPPALAFKPIQRIGGSTGWYHANWLWRVRGFIDLLCGGVGMRRGRRHFREISIGDTIDWWRVEDFVPDHRLRLYAEMKVPGRAWLDFIVEQRNGGSTIRQTAIFDPIGLPGLAYWYIIYPFHKYHFRGMIRNIARACRQGGQAHEAYSSDRG